MPDVAVARGTDDEYEERHPERADLGLVAEVSDSTLPEDQGSKADLYARGGIEPYWILNLVDRQMEVMTQPTATGYAQQAVYHPGEAVPFRLDGRLIGTLAVEDVLPRIVAE